MIIRRGYSLVQMIAALIFGLYFLIIASCSEQKTFHIIENQTDQPLIDLSSWSFIEDGPIRLFGDSWQFYWHELYTPEDFKRGVIKDGVDSIQEPVLAVGGEAWNGLDIEGKSLSAYGYGTYRNMIRFPEAGTVYAFYMTNQDSSYRLWLNGRLSAENGIVASNAESYKPQRLPVLFYHFAEEQEVEIVIQIANYTHKWGGLTNNIFIGLPEQIQSYLSRQFLSALFLCGAILIMVFYHLFLYINRRKAVSSLLFAISCFSIFVWYLFSQDYLFFQIFPDFPLVPGLRIHIFMLFLTSPVFVLFIHTVFPGQLKLYILKAVICIGIIFCLSALFTPVKILTSIMLKAYYVVVVLDSVLIFSILIKSAAKKRTGAIISLSGIIIFVAVSIYDIISNLKIIVGSPSGPFLPFALFIFILLQSFILAMKFSGAFRELDTLTRGLDLKVKERTIQLAKAQKEIGEREKLAAIGTMVGGISHEIMNPLSGITGPVSILKREIENSSLENKALLRKHLDYIESNSDEMSRVVKNLNALIKEQNIIKHPIHFSEIAEKVLVQFQNSEADVTFESLAGENDIISTDEGILFQIINNLVANAITATGKAGRVQIVFMIRENGTAVLTVEDDGYGMSAEVMAKAFDAFFTTNETTGGSGLGLYLVKRLTKSLGWEVEIESEIGKGTRVILTIRD